MGQSETKNFILAAILCMGVLLGWQYLIGQPMMEAERTRQEMQAQQQAEAVATGEIAPGAALPGPLVAAPVARDAALATGPRLRIETPSLTGSIALAGGRLDDLQLATYRETISPDSKKITLFSPAGTARPYYAEFGWRPAPGAEIATPSSDSVWKVVGGTSALSPSTPVLLEWDNGADVTFTRRLSIDDRYMFTVEDGFRNDGAGAITLFPYGLVARHGIPETTGIYILHEGLVGVLGSELVELDYDDITEEGRRQADTRGGWLGITDKYWLAALIPDQQTQVKARFNHDAAGGRDIFQTDYLGDPLTAAPGAAVERTSRLFAGAKEVAVIDGYNEEYKIEKFDLAIDWGSLYFLTKPIFKVLHFFYGLVGNFGVAIILLVMVIKLLFFPLANKSYVAMAKMKRLQPQMTVLRERFENDKPKLQQEMMELYKREKVNPLAGCLPILLQIPVFFALYKVLFITIEMRHAPFFGWIHDLSAPDPTSWVNLFGLLPFDGGIAGPLSIGVWPVLMGISMFVQQKLQPAPPDPMQQKIFQWMPVLFTFMLGSFASGLVIYWFTNNLLSIIQQMVIMKRTGTPIQWNAKSPAPPAPVTLDKK